MDKREKQIPKLLIIENGQVVLEFPLDKDVIRIGRSNENEIILNDKAVSRVHAEINNLHGECYIRDLNSKNGTYLNDQLLTEARLYDGDEIRIGKTSFRFSDPSAVRDGSAQQVKTEEGEEEWFEFGEAGKKKPKKVKKERAPLFTPKNVLIMISAVLIVVIVLVLNYMFSIEKELPLTPLPLPQNVPYGFMLNGDQRHADRVTYTFKKDFEGPAELHFKVWDIDNDQELVIYLNGEKIHSVEATGDGAYSAIRSIILPDRLLTSGENTIVFDNTRNPPLQDFWAVSDVSVTPAEVIQCDPDEGRDTFKVAVNRWEARKVRVGNLYECITKLDRAIKLGKECVPKPDYYLDALDLYQRAKEEMDLMYKDIVFNTEKYKRLNDWSSALAEAQKILSLIPDPDDERYIKALREIRILKKKKVEADKKAAQQSQ